MGQTQKTILILLGIAATLYLIFCVVVFVFQRSLIYFPQPRTNPSAGIMTLQTGSGTVLISTRPHAGPNALIYFGGNAEDVSQAIPELATAFPNHAIYSLHYPGFGGSPGSPSEQAIFTAALALFDRVCAEHKNVVVIGRSLGTAAALRVASSRPVERLVLVTPFDSLTDVAAQQFPFLPVRLLLRDRFESWRFAPHVTAPTKIIIAEQDELIPRASTDRLLTRFKQGIASYVVIPNAGHNTVSDSPNYWPLLTSN